MCQYDLYNKEKFIMAGPFSGGFRPKKETDNTSTSDSPAQQRGRSGSKQGEQTVAAGIYAAEQRIARGEQSDYERYRENRMLLAARDASIANRDLNADAKQRRESLDAWYRQRAENPIEPHEETQQQLDMHSLPTEQRKDHQGQTQMDAAGVSSTEQVAFRKVHAARNRALKAGESSNYENLSEHYQVTQEDIDAAKIARRKLDYYKRNQG